MNRIHHILFFVICLLTCGRLAAQDAATSFSRANQAYALYESERDKGNSPDAMYARLMESYTHFVNVVEAPNNSQYLTGTKNRLRAMYPQLINGAVYYSGQKQPVKGLELAQAYIEMPNLSIFRGEMLNKDSRYASVLFYAAQAAYGQKKFTQAQRYFEEYLNIGTGNELQEKDSYVYLNMIFATQKNYVQQEAILEKACARFPQTLDFLYNLVNVHIATNNMEKLVATIDRILTIDPNDVKVLPIKARIMERQGNNTEALNVYKRLYALNPGSFELLTGLARANFNVATEIVNSGATIVNDAEYALIRQKAMVYLFDAQDLFLKILEIEPTSKAYIQGLSGVYKYMGMDAESEVLAGIAADGASYESFPARLEAYRAAHPDNDVTPVGGGAADDEPVPVPIDPAKLVINVDQFADANDNRVIDAGESFSVKFTISNIGKGDAYNVRIRLSEQQGFDTYFEGPRELDGGHIPAGTSKEFTFNYLAKTDLPTTDAKINIYAFEANGFDADPAEIDVATEEFAMPRLEMADYLFTAEEGTSIKLGSNGKLTMALRNAGRVTARNVRLKFTLPSNVFPSGDNEINVDSIAPGDWVTLEYGFMVNNRFAGDSIAVVVNATESSRQSFINEAYKVKMGEYLAQTQVTGISTAKDKKAATSEKVTLGLDTELLDNVPVGSVNPHRYALVIGNEDYSRPGAGAEINVPYAVNDALVFKEYCIRTFGVPDAQVRVVPNATTGLMHESLQWLVGMASTDPEAELIFYYSGHGNNDEATKEPYLLPVDLTGKNISLGISLSNLYSQLATYPIKGAYVFLDACFSGGYKSAQPLIAQKGVRVVPKASMPQGNTLSFSSSSGDQTSSVYHEKKQGYYTYFLIKTLQDAGGDISMKELFERTNAAVKKATAKIGKMQEPQCMASPTWIGWEDIHLKTTGMAN